MKEPQAHGIQFFLEKMFAKLKSPLLLIAAIFLLLWCVSALRSCHLYKDGIDALNERRLLYAITCFERSGLYYAPFNPFPEKSVAALLQIKREREFEKSGFNVQAGKAAVRVMNQTSPWGKTAKDENRNAIRSFPKKSLTSYALTHISFFGWFAFTLLFFFRGFDETGTFKPASGKPALMKALIGLGSWLLLIRYF